MIVDGKRIAAELREKLTRAVKELSLPPTLAIVVVGEDPVIESFVRLKKKIGETLGVQVREHRFVASVPETTLLAAMKTIAGDKSVDGVIVQLPLPPALNTQVILDAVPSEKDVDMLSTESVAAFRRGDASILPPIAGAIQEILERSGVPVEGKESLVLGRGRLVGVPAELFLRHNNAHVTVVGREVERLSDLTREADIIVCGAGQPGLLKPEMLKQGATVIDAGTSEAGGKIVGDADPRCAEVASVFTPVPGGVGPIAVALIFKNLLVLATVRTKQLSR
ncbi:MAG TPA: bifunctional 5,10-methylenetetrahydrofolate dehydrogenase/5,10-methenyltetrahydrofolate cyclohydrolase [Candidatus Paceibacterota bacterium]